MPEELATKRAVLTSIADQLSLYPATARLARSLASTFKPTVANSLERACRLAYQLYVREQPTLCLQVCQLLNDLAFTGNYNLWTWVERTLALEWKLRTQLGQLAAAQACAAAIRATDQAGAPSLQKTTAAALQNRLRGGLLYDAQISAAEQVGEVNTANEYRMAQIGELLFMQALGGSAALPVVELERRLNHDLARLRAVCK